MLYCNQTKCDFILKLQKFLVVVAEELEIPEVEIAELPEQNDPDFILDDSIQENTDQSEDHAPVAVEIIRSKPVSIFPISKRSERYQLISAFDGVANAAKCN